MLSNSLFRPYKKAVIPSSFTSGHKFFAQCTLKHDAEKQAAPLRPKEDGRDGLERPLRTLQNARAAGARSSHVKIRKIFLGELKCVDQAHATGRLTRSSALSRSNIRVSVTFALSMSNCRAFRSLPLDSEIATRDPQPCCETKPCSVSNHVDDTRKRLVVAKMSKHHQNRS